jgi:NAD+ diphosphatase
MDFEIAFGGEGLDRADAIRGDADALAGLMNYRARLLLLDGLEPRFGEDGGLVFGSMADAADDDELVFLGLDEAGRGCFVVAPAAAAGSVAPPNPRMWQGMAGLTAHELAIYGTARAVAGWHARHRFCPRCRAGTVLAKGGWQRNCLGAVCGAEHFPRVDPVVIMLVEHEGSLLLGRQPRFPDKRFSALAGFLEPGETLEAAVAREVFEEAGVRVREVAYVASQPWPFPSTLMLGCYAKAEGRDLVIDKNELDDARWFTRDEVAEAMAAGERGEVGAAFGAPPKHAVAHVLLRWWLAR